MPVSTSTQLKCISVGSFARTTGTPATKDVITDYDLPAEMTATGEVVDGQVHIHAVMAVGP